MPTQYDRLSMIIRKTFPLLFFPKRKPFCLIQNIVLMSSLLTLKFRILITYFFTDKFLSTILYYFTYKTIIFYNSWIIRILYYLEHILLYLYYISHQKTLHHIRFDNFRSRDYTEFRYNSYHINFHTQNRKCQRCTL